MKSDLRPSGNAGKRRHSWRGGMAATELALCLPLLMLIVYGSVDFGRCAHSYIALSNAARVGAEYGATHRCTVVTQSNWETQLRESVTHEMENLHEFDPALLDVSVDIQADDHGLKRIVVSTWYPFQTAVEWPGLPSVIPMHQQMTMREFR